MYMLLEAFIQETLRKQWAEKGPQQRTDRHNVLKIQTYRTRSRTETFCRDQTAA
jgi:hypothetical protein